MSSKREKENAKRRQEKWEEKRRKAYAKRARRAAAVKVLGSLVAVVAVLALVFLIVRMVNPPQRPPNPAASASSMSPDPDNPCPPTGITPVESAPSLKGPPDPKAAAGKVKATITTTCGPIEVELTDKAPKAVANFAFLAGEKFYDRTPCHRLTTSGIFVLQCGDPTGTGTGGPGYTFGPVENAPADGNYPAGTLAMARAQSEDSQGSQFFITYKDSPIPGGYTVFGKVTSGLDVVEKVAAGGTGEAGSEQPRRAIALEKVVVQ